MVVDLVPAPIPRSGRRWLPFGLLGAIGLALAVETFIARINILVTHPWAFAWRRGDWAARQVARGCEILCFGDSLMQCGILPRVLEDRLALRSYNLAIGAGSPATTYFLLRRALESGARPRAVLVEYLSLGGDHGGGQFPLMSEVADLRDCLDLAWTARDPGLVGPLVLARLFPSVRHRYEIRGVILTTLWGGTDGRLVQLTTNWRNWTANRGAWVHAKAPDFRGNADLYAEVLYPPAWSCNPVSVSYFRRFLELASAHQISVFWLLPPLSPEVHAKRERMGLESQDTRFAHDAQARFPNLIVVDGRHAGYDHTVHVDPIHLDRQGALALSAGVADILVRHVRGAATDQRWVELPAYQDRPTRVAVEDWEESRVAIQSPANWRR